MVPPRSGLLASVERPIVLVAQRTVAALAPEVAPGNPLVGVLLAYTPLHHLLLEAAGGPLVMTSGNLSEEPMAANDDEALERLGGSPTSSSPTTARSRTAATTRSRA